DENDLIDIGLSEKRRHAAVDDLEHLLARIELELRRSSIDDRAALFHAATDAWQSCVTWAGLPVVLLDVTVDSRSEQEFVGAIVKCASTALATVPDGDIRAVAAFERMGATVDLAADDADANSDVAHLREYVFAKERPPIRDRAGDVTLFSAPGEGREA